MKTAATIIGGGLLLFFASCGSSSEPQSAKLKRLDSLKVAMAGLRDQITTLEEEIAKSDTSKKEKLKIVEIKPASPELFRNYIDIQGRVDADENVSINAEMAGTVAKIHAQVGDEVKTGQVIAELDSKMIQQGIAEVQTGLDLANTLYEKQKSLWDQKIGTEVQYLAAKTQKESMEKRMAAIHQQLEMSKIKSPINGIVDAIDIKIGQATMPGLPAVRVVNMRTLKVTGEVAESYLAKVKAGNPVEILLPDMKDTIRTKISYVAKVISPLNRTFTVTVNLDGKKELHPNMVAVLKIIDYSNPAAFIVDMNAIQKGSEGDFILIAENKKAKKVKVKVGRVYNGKAEILEGLKTGDQLITKGFQELNDGEEIKF